MRRAAGWGSLVRSLGRGSPGILVVSEGAVELRGVGCRVFTVRRCRRCYSQGFFLAQSGRPSLSHGCRFQSMTNFVPNFVPRLFLFFGGRSACFQNIYVYRRVFLPTSTRPVV